MKPCIKAFRLSYLLLIVVGTVFGLSTSRLVAQDVAATYVTGTEVAVKSNGIDVEGKTLNIALEFAPSPGTQLMIVRNTGPGIIRGRFNNLAQGQTIELSYAGLVYHFVANYYGGNGNDLVLLWTTGDELVARAARSKLDGQLLLALRKSRREPPFDKATTLEPDIPIKDGDRVLVDIEGSISKALLNQARPFTSGPETWNRGVHLSMMKPSRLVIPGMKLVPENRQRSSPIAVLMSSEPADPLPFSAE